MDGSNKDRNVSRLTEAIPLLLGYIRQEAPLIHCITNPISINDCANILLAIGARPIMAEHPKEVAEITA
ncbi:MAG: hydroxyethylthiazole kinase, partial [Selenomonadaceae bacterium]|nr:hydroxyethylthiazole kinase [Selenomonadaceae bacterium]